MKEYRVIGLFLLFLASILILGPFWGKKGKFSKMDRFQKVHIEKNILLFILLLLALPNSIYFEDTLIFMVFGLFIVF